MFEGYRTVLKSILRLTDCFYGENPETEYLEKLLKLQTRDHPGKIAAWISTYFERAAWLYICVQQDEKQQSSQAKLEEIKKLQELGGKLMANFGFVTEFDGVFPNFRNNRGEEFYTVESALFSWISF